MHHSDHAKGICFSPDSSWIASASSDWTVGVWDAHTGKRLATLEGHEDWVRCVVFSPDQRKLASSGWDDRVIVWDTTTWTRHLVLHEHTHWVPSMSFSSDSLRIASGSYDGTVRIWDANSASCLFTLGGEHVGEIYHVAFCRDDSQVGVMDEAGRYHVWDLTTEDHPKLENTLPDFFTIDAAGWLHGPISPSGPMKRLCWIPPSRRQNAPWQF